jgi:hypothetical protein
MIEIGDLVKVSTPDDDDGKLGVVTEMGEAHIYGGTREEPPYYDILLLGETETKNFISWEVVQRESR